MPRSTARAAGVTGADALLALLPEHPALLDDLAGAIAVGETYFFRDPDQFEMLRSGVLPGPLAAHGPALRVWSAGCASGEEAYSLAIVLAEEGLRPELPVVGEATTSRLRGESGPRPCRWRVGRVRDDLMAHGEAVGCAP